MEIVYCGGCGKLLRRDDFDRGLARFLDNRPWCSDCKPPEKEPIPAAPRRQGSSAKHARINTPRRGSPAAPGVSRPVLLGIGLGAVLLLVALFAATRPTPPPAPPVDRPPRPPVDRPPDYSDAEKLLKDLESFASLSPPEKILARCEELAPKFRGAPQEKRFREIEAAAKEQKKTRDLESQFARDSDSLRKLIEEDARFKRSDEVLRRFKALCEIAGARSAEVDRRLAEYQKAKRDPPPENRAGPYAADDEGFIRNWLVLGVFSNSEDKGADTDYLNTESAADPLAGQAVDGKQWAAHVSPEARIDFFRVSHLGINKPRDWVVAYAACVVQTADPVAAEFRLGSDDGGTLWVDGKQIGKVHRSRAYKPDDDRYAVPLAPGLHRILFKVDNHAGGFEFGLRIVTPDGKPVPGLRIWN